MVLHITIQHFVLFLSAKQLTFRTKRINLKIESRSILLRFEQNRHR